MKSAVIPLAPGLVLCDSVKATSTHWCYNAIQESCLVTYDVILAELIDFAI